MRDAHCAVLPLVSDHSYRKGPSIIYGKHLPSLLLPWLLLIALLPGGVLDADVVASGTCGAEGDNLA